MITIAQDTVNDIVLEGHDIKVVSDVGAYAIIIADAIRTVKGELQLDIERGVDYFGTIYASVNGVPNWKAAVKKIIRGYDFVKDIDSLDVTIDNSNKTLSYKAIIRTDSGDVTVEG